MRFPLSLRVRPVIAGWALISLAITRPAPAEVPIEGFLPFVGIALTNEFQDSTLPNASPTFFIAEPSNQPGGHFLGQGSSTYYDLALFDTGAATHILTSQATTGFDISGEGFTGTNFQQVGGATGIMNLRINDPLGVYMAGLEDRTGAGTTLTMNNSALRGQTSFSLLSAPQQWTLPNVIGLPMAAHHQARIQNSNPQIFQHGGRTVRTPNIDLHDLGATGHGIQRRTPLRLVPGENFITGPLYVQNLDIFTFNFHDNPLSPTVVPNGSLVVEVDIANGTRSQNDKPFLFDTGASLTVISEQMAVRLGFDPILDTPDFVLSVEGSGGTSSGVPGFYVDELQLDTIGGTFHLTNVPVAVLDVTNPSDPGNIVDGILGMNVFAGRDLVIDANPSIGQGGVGPSLYISDPVAQSHAWSSSSASASWTTAANWSAAGVPAKMWDARVANVSGSNQEAVLSTASTIYRATISGSPTAEMQVRVATGGTLTTFADIRVNSGGRLHLDGGKVDAQFVDVLGGTLSGNGQIFVGSGPLTGTVRIDSGVVAPGSSADPTGKIDIIGDLSMGADGTMEIDLGGTVGGVSHDLITTDRFAFLSGVLEVSLSDGYQPDIGSVFTVLTTSRGVSGTFDSLALPSGYAWNVNYLSTSVRLEVTGIGQVGDFNGDGQLDCMDINLLTNAVAAGGIGPYDVTGDGQVNGADITEWVVNIKGTLMGDANLDGVVDGSDFGTWNSSKFTFVAEWCSGDFNGDGVVDGTDFGTWNSNKFQSAAANTAAVPEPAAGVLLLVAAVSCLTARGRRCDA